VTHDPQHESPSEPPLSPIAENPDDVADQELITVEADTEVPPAVIVRRGWVADTFQSFHVRDFLFWSGALLGNVGSWMQNAALLIVVYSMLPSRRRCTPS
jgi:hypothetical protein